MYLVGRGRLALADSEEDLLAAAASLEQAVEENPGCAPARVRLAEAAARLFDTTGSQEWKDRAIAEAHHAIELNGDSPEPYLVLAAVYGSANEGQLKLEALRNAARVSKTADAYLALGSEATEAALYDEAEAALQTAINLRPDHIGPYHSLGYLYARMGRYDAAANEFRHASRAAPANVLGHINLGAILYFQGRKDEARTAFEAAVAAEPNEVAYSNLGGLYFEEARYGDATEMFEKAIALSGEVLTNDRYYLVGNLAGAQYWGGEKERAQETYRRAIELAEEFLEKNPRNASVMADLAGYHAMINERDRALELLEMATHCDIRDAYVMGTMAESFEDLGDREQAIRWIGDALENGLAAGWAESRPSLNNLREDVRYKDLIDHNLGRS
jgi:serine/threonine-protein kinase